MNKVYRLSFAFIISIIVFTGVLVALSLLDSGPSLPSVVQAAPMFARATGAITEVLVTGVTQTLQTFDYTNGEKFTNTGKEFIVIVNANTQTITATFVTAATYGGFEISDVDVDIPASTTYLVGPFNTSIFNQKSGTDKGTVYINWSGTETYTDSTTYKVFQLDDGS
jgi:hypothetical protein